MNFHEPAIYCRLFNIRSLGRVGWSGAENFGRLANPRENIIGPEGKVPNEGRIWSRAETEAEKKG